MGSLQNAILLTGGREAARIGQSSGFGSSTWQKSGQRSCYLKTKLSFSVNLFHFFHLLQHLLIFCDVGLISLCLFSCT